MQQTIPYNIYYRVYDHQMTITHPEVIPLRDGYTFAGWLAYNSKDYDVDLPGESATWGNLYNSDPISYYAQWEKN